MKESRSLGSGGVLLTQSEATYDLLGRLVEQTRHLWSSDPASASAVTTATAYDAAGNVLTATDPLGRITSFAYDAAERVTSRTDPAGNRVDYTLNAAGQPESITLTETVASGGAVSTTTTPEYDALGRTVASTDPLGNTTRQVFTAAGHARFVIDAEGHSTERVYDSLGRMLSETMPEGIRIELGYDAKGNRTSYRDALGNTTTWTYDALDRVTAVAYPDGTSEIYAHDGTGNVTQITQASGTVVAQTHDAAGRLTARAITPAAGVEGPTAESFAYDGLGRLTQAVSGSGAEAIASTRTYDSLSRLTSETTAGKTVAYQHDPAGSITGITYPSGVTVTHQVDALGRIAAIPGVATYGYRGPDLVAQKTVGALSGSTTYDGGRRPIRDVLNAPNGLSVYDERIAWSPRTLKVGTRRADQGETRTLAHDGASRLLAASRTVDLPENNTASVPATATTAFEFQYDVAQNLLARSVSEDSVETVTTMPLDGSGRNRPGQIGGVPLGWDAQGNLTQRGDQIFHYDYRNRLIRVTGSGGTEVASYTYDAFNRRTERTVGGTTEETVWAGWQAIERYDGGQLAERRTYGVGLDEIVRLETDLDGNGTLEQSYAPVYDQTGNLTLVADEATGKVIERYDYTPYGERTIRVDSTPPEVEQVRLKNGQLWLEMSEAVLPQAVQDAVVAGNLTLTATATGDPIAFTATQPVQLGRQAFRRIVLTPATVPAVDTAIELRIEPQAVVDPFGNELPGAYVLALGWPAADVVLDDTGAPEIAAVRLVDGFVEIELTEEPDLATVAMAVAVDGSAITWTLAGDRYTVRSTEALAAGAATLTVNETLADLAGTALAQPLTMSVPASDEDTSLYLAVDPRKSPASTVNNRFGFHGRDYDLATGMVYFRNRWLDPEMGRFVSQDPMGYVDSANLYQAFLNNPVDYRDPMGLYIVGGQREVALIRSVFEKTGASELAAQIRLDARPVPMEFRENPTEMTWETRITNGYAEWKSSLDGDPLDQLAWLFDMLIDEETRFEFSVTTSEKGSGGFAVPEPKPFFHYELGVNPALIPDARVVVIGPDGKTRFDGTIPDVETAVVHEFGHAFGRTIGGIGLFTQEIEYSLHFENVYRQLTTPDGQWPTIRLYEYRREDLSDYNRQENAVKDIMVKRFFKPRPEP